MIFLDPSPNSLVQIFGQGCHFCGLPVRNASAEFIAGQIALFPKSIELLHQAGVCCYRQPERLNYSKMVCFASGAVAGCGQSRRRGLQSGVVGDVEAPIDGEIGGLASFKIAVDQREQVENLLPARLVLRHPAVAKPCLQAHACLQSGRFSSVS